jgi:hypothetical protein
MQYILIYMVLTSQYRGQHDTVLGMFTTNCYVEVTFELCFTWYLITYFSYNHYYHYYYYCYYHYYPYYYY